jgi:N-acetylglucosamine-6-phosphate deacetylase
MRMTARVLYVLNGRLITPHRLIGRGGLRIEDGIITHVFAGNGPLDDFGETAGSVDPGLRIIDAAGRYISPGFVDLHLHGGGGADIMDGTVEAINTISATHAAGGSTSIYPSTLTSSDSDLQAALNAFRAAATQTQASSRPRGARLAGVHLEGPYFGDAQRGAQDPRYLRSPEPEHYMPILDSFPEVARVSAAPELQGGAELGRELRRRGVLASIAHTDASFEQVVEAMEAGYSHVTHLYSGMSGVRRFRARRVAGAVEAGLFFDSLTVEIIADGMHLPPSLLRLVFKCKGPDRIALVTDAMRAAGMPDGEYLMGSTTDGQRVIVDEGVAWLPDRFAFAGSVALTNRLVRTMVEQAGVSVCDAVTMASATPARIIGAWQSIGSLDVGKRGDVVVFDDAINVKHTIVGGEVVFTA